MAPQILLFAGTSEGRRLAERLSRAMGISFYVSVATAYGETLLEHAHASILQGRMDREEIIAFCGHIPSSVWWTPRIHTQLWPRNISEAPAGDGDGVSAPFA